MPLEERDGPANEVEIWEEVHQAHGVPDDDLQRRSRGAVIAHDAEPCRPLTRRLPVPQDLKNGKIDRDKEQGAADDDADRRRTGRGEAERQGDQEQREDGQSDNQVIQQRGHHA